MQQIEHDLVHRDASPFQSHTVSTLMARTGSGLSVRVSCRFSSCSHKGNKMRLRMSDICTKEPVARSATANTPQFGADKCRLAHSRVTTQEAANTTTRKGEREGEWAKSTLTYEILVSIHRYEVRVENDVRVVGCLLYTSPSPRDRTRSRMPSSA